MMKRSPFDDMAEQIRSWDDMRQNTTMQTLADRTGGIRSLAYLDKSKAAYSVPPGSIADQIRKDMEDIVKQGERSLQDVFDDYHELRRDLAVQNL